MALSASMKVESSIGLKLCSTFCHVALPLTPFEKLSSPMRDVTQKPGDKEVECSPRPRNAAPLRRNVHTTDEK